MDESTYYDQLGQLAEQLAEMEALLDALAASQVDAAFDPTSSLLLLLREVQVELRRAQASLEEQIRQQDIELARANRVLQALIETMPVGAVVTDGAGKVLTTNYAARAILGSSVYGSLESPKRSYTPHDPDGTPLGPQDMPLMQSLRERRVIRDVEILIRRADGEERTILASAAPVLDDKGEIVGGIAVFQDISDQKQAQRALERYANRLQAMYEMDQAILAARSAQEIAKAALLHAPQLLGCSRSSVTLFDREAGKVSVLATYPEGSGLTGWRALWKDASFMEKLSRGKIHGVEDVQSWSSSSPMGHLWAEGVRAYVNVPLIIEDKLAGSLNLGMVRPGPLTSEQMEIAQELAAQVARALRQARLQEEVQRYASQLESLVARRTAALQASEERFRIIFEESILGIALLDARGKIVASNPTLHHMLGYSEDQLRGTVLADYSHPEDVEIGEDLFQALVRGELNFYQVERRHVRRDGQTRWSELTISRIKRSQKGVSKLAIAMLADITERRLSQEALLRAEGQAIASRLGPSLAHEINNPLQSVIGCLGLAEEMLEEGAEARRYLEIAMEELDRVASIVAQLRDLSREMEAKPKEPADLNAIVETALFLTKKRCQNQGVKVEWSPSTSLPPVPLVPDRVQQVVLNLVLNAVDAMPTGGNLQVRTAATDQPPGIHIQVADTGVGIEPARLPQLFEPFHSTRPDGLGLGLYISKKIVEEHGGSIEVTSCVGQGTTFTVWLPR